MQYKFELSLLTLWYRTLSEKLVVTQLVEEFLVFRGTQKCKVVFTRACHWSLS
jgi:hypothetical protein